MSVCSPGSFAPYGAVSDRRQVRPQAGQHLPGHAAAQPVQRLHRQEPGGRGAEQRLQAAESGGCDRGEVGAQLQIEAKVLCTAGEEKKGITNLIGHDKRKTYSTRTNTIIKELSYLPLHSLKCICFWLTLLLSIQMSFTVMRKHVLHCQSKFKNGESVQYTVV